MLRSIRQQGSMPQTSGKQHRSLQINHLNIFFLRNIIPGLEQHIVLLSPTHVHRYLVKKIYRPAQILVLAMLDTLVSRDRCRITTQDCHVAIPLFMNGRPASPQLRIIHHIIMQKRVIVEYFYPDSGFQHLLNIFPVKIVSH